MLTNLNIAKSLSVRNMPHRATKLAGLFSSTVANTCLFSSRVGSGSPRRPPLILTDMLAARLRHIKCSAGDGAAAMISVQSGQRVDRSHQDPTGPMVLVLYRYGTCTCTGSVYGLPVGISIRSAERLIVISWRAKNISGKSMEIG